MSPLVEEFPVEVGGRRVMARLVQPPPDRLAPRPGLLISLASDRVTAQTVHPYSIGTEVFVGRGHRAVSVDLPHHGERVDADGEGIVGFRNAFVAGRDPFARLVEEGRALVGLCLARGLAEAGRIVVDGTSRGGYMALRLMAADRRIKAGAAHAPVTHWRVLREFAADWDRQDVADLRLTRYVDQLAGRRVHLAIGNHDERVSTAACCRLYLALHDANRERGLAEDGVEFLCTPDEGHSLGDEWRRRGVEFLLRQVED